MEAFIRNKYEKKKYIAKVTYYLCFFIVIFVCTINSYNHIFSIEETFAPVEKRYISVQCYSLYDYQVLFEFLVLNDTSWFKSVYIFMSLFQDWVSSKPPELPKGWEEMIEQEKQAKPKETKRTSVSNNNEINR